MNTITPELASKIEETYKNSIVMKESLKTLEKEVVRHGHDIEDLQISKNESSSFHATFEERLKNHMAVDEKTQIETNKRLDELDTKIDTLTKVVAMAGGFVTLASLIWPFLAPKLFG